MVKPIVFLAFANDQEAFLSNLEKERDTILKALHPLVELEKLEVYSLGASSVDDIFDTFTKFKDRIVIFHYGGHANSEALQLEDQLANASGLAKLIAQQKELQLVFLNGCSTRNQVQQLVELGVKAVIATHNPIEDDKALVFSEQFYESLASEATLEDAFKVAVSRLETTNNSPEGGISQHRFLKGYKAKQEIRENPWGLFLPENGHSATWKITHVNRALNERLSIALVQAMAETHNPLASRFLKSVAEREDWWAVEGDLDNAKRVIVKEFVGVLGTHLRKLMAIGKEVPPTSQTYIKYIEQCASLSTCALDLLNFVYLSCLWDIMSKQSLELAPEYKQVLHHFFQDPSASTQERLMLLQTCQNIFMQQGLDFPLEELKNLDKDLEEESPFCQALLHLEALADRSKTNDCNVFDSLEAERDLGIILYRLAFLSNYRMVSMKNIGFSAIRNQDPRYVHYYAPLEVDTHAGSLEEKVKYTEQTVETEAILLYQKDYQESINLFPFIIDYNALTGESGSKVCFYTNRDLSDGSLNFRFLENKQLQNISFSDILESHHTLDDFQASIEERRKNVRNHEDKQSIRASYKKLNQLITDNELRSRLNLDRVWLYFEQAKKTILGKAKESPLSSDDFFEDDF